MALQAPGGAVTEWPLYRPVADRFEDRGYRVATQVADPRGTRFELDVVAYTVDLDDVRIVEIKRKASDALLEQCRDRWRYARRVYAAAPRGEADRLVGRDDDLGVLAVGRDGAHELQTAAEVTGRVEAGKADALRRVLRSRRT